MSDQPISSCPSHVVEALVMMALATNPELQAHTQPAGAGTLGNCPFDAAVA